MKDSEYMGTTNEELILSLAESVKDSDDDYKKEFIDMVERYYDDIG